MEMIHKVIESYHANPGSVIGALIGVLGTFAYRKVKDYINSDDFTYKINRVRKTPIIERPSTELDRSKFSDRLNNFIDKMEENVNTKNLYSLYNNLDSLDIIDNDMRLSQRLTKERISGQYSSISNTVYINTLSKDDSLNHELMHMSSAQVDRHRHNTGFCQTTKPFLFQRRFIGNGLNEGYTELMTDRLFNSNYLSAYHYLSGVCEYIEDIIGKEAMQELYFKSDLRGLINNLSTYADKETVLDLLRFTDTLLYVISRRVLVVDDLAKCIIVINHALTKLNNGKLYHDYLEEKITKEEMNKLSDEFDKSLNTKLLISPSMAHIINGKTEKYMKKDKKLA